MRIGAGLLEQRLLQWWEQSGALAHRTVSLDALGSVGSAVSAALHCPQLSLRAGDGGRVRFDCSFEARLSGALPGAESRFELRCHLLALPRLGWDEQARLVVTADFSDARVRDARARPLGRAAWAMRAFDPMRLDPFGSRERLTELGVYALERALESLGERRVVIEHPALPAIADALRGAPLRLAVGDSHVTITAADAIPDLDAGGPAAATEDSPAPLWLRVEPRLVEHFLRPWVADAFPHIEIAQFALAFHDGSATLRVQARATALPLLRQLGVRAVARLGVGRSSERLWLELDALRCESPRLLAPFAPLSKGWFRRALRRRASLGRQPVATVGAALELSDLRFAEGAVIAELRPLLARPGD